jgi:ABC-type phosphate/phosphonate transport system substrate-binding protein
MARGLILRGTLQTGSHRASAAAVADGRADYAAIDAVTWAMIARIDTPDLHVIGHTAPTPALPFIAGLGTNAAIIFDALDTAIAALSQNDRDTLHLRGITRIPAADYLAVRVPPAPQPQL